MATLLTCLRPQQWLKNLFVFLPLFFSQQLGNWPLFAKSIAAFFAFSLAASAIYCFNDICDVEDDRKHPEKCKRPIASGAISVKCGYALMVLCVVLSLGVVILFGQDTKWMQAGVIAFYFVLNVAYCIKLKALAIIDVAVIATGFVLRVLMGGVATGIALSEWIVLMTFLLALFLAFAKRRDDVLLFEKTGVLPRKNTANYNLDFVNQVLSIVASVTLVAYIMYTISPDVTARFHSRHVYFTALFVLLGIVRYLQITLVRKESGSPTKVLMRDRFIQACIVGWVLTFFVIIYGKDIMGL